MAWTSDLTTGIGEHLDANGCGTWRATGVYGSTEIGIVVAAIPPSPDSVVVITAYTADEPYVDQADTIVMVQVRCRGGKHPDSVNNLADPIKELLDGATYLTLNGIEVTQIVWRSGAWLGRDSNDRFERTDNYMLYAVRPTVHRPV